MDNKNYEFILSNMTMKELKTFYKNLRRYGLMRIACSEDRSFYDDLNNRDFYLMDITILWPNKYLNATKKERNNFLKTKGVFFDKLLTLCGKVEACWDKEIIYKILNINKTP